MHHLLDPFCWVVATALQGTHALASLVFDPTSGACWVTSTLLLLGVVRGALLPLAYHQSKSFRRLHALTSQIAAAKEKYKGDPEAVARATIAIYKQEQVNPMASVIPYLVQIPVLMALYFVLARVVIANVPRYGIAQPLLDSARHADMFGAPMAASLHTSAVDVVALGGDPSATRLVALVLAGLVMATTLLSSVLSLNAQTLRTGPRWLGPVLTVASLVAVGSVTAALPIMLGVYLSASTVWALVQNRVLRKLFPLAAHEVPVAAPLL